MMSSIMQETVCGLRLIEDLKTLEPKRKRKKVTGYFNRVEQAVKILESCPDSIYSFMYGAIYAKLREQIDDIILPEEFLERMKITLSGVFRNRQRRHWEDTYPGKRNTKEAVKAQAKHDKRLEDWKGQTP